MSLSPFFVQIHIKYNFNSINIPRSKLKAKKQKWLATSLNLSEFLKNTLPFGAFQKETLHD